MGVYCSILCISNWCRTHVYNVDLTNILILVTALLKSITYLTERDVGTLYSSSCLLNNISIRFVSVFTRAHTMEGYCWFKKITQHSQDMCTFRGTLIYFYITLTLPDLGTVYVSNESRYGRTLLRSLIGYFLVYFFQNLVNFSHEFFKEPCFQALSQLKS